MDVYSENVDFIERRNKEVYKDITDLDLEVKIEKLDKERNIKTEVFEENKFIPFQIIEEKRKNKEISNLVNENKKIKQELVLFEEIDDKEESQEIRMEIDDSNKQVINKNEFFY